MKDIKFRAWSDEDKQMLYGLDAIVGEYDGYKYNLNDIDELPIMQYTGLNDCKGREVYEGDIILYNGFYIGDHREDGGRGVVKFTNGSYDVHIENKSQHELWNIVNNCCGEVVGNIYENFELLEVKHG